MRKSFTKKLVNSFTRKQTSRTAAEISVESSASAADISQSNHSAATSRNFRELSARLDEYLEQVDSAGGEVELDVISMSRQIEKVNAYLNGSLPESVAEVSIEHTSLIELAAWSAKEAYMSNNNESRLNQFTPPKKFAQYQPTEQCETINASFRDGTVKATRVRLFSPLETTSPWLLVVALRGSTSKRRDWTINFDDLGDGTDGKGFINDGDDEFRVHGGFLDCAKAMVGEVSTAITSVLSKCEGDGVTNIQLLFTGHSAGGAIASLLYAHMTSQNASTLKELTIKFASIHCIVFGAPPVSTPALGSRGSNSICYSIINEGDPVPRIDKNYAEALIKLYISPFPEPSTTLELPRMLLANFGTILFLKDEEPGFWAVPEKGNAHANNREVLETTIFGNPRAHKMDRYLWKLGLV